MNEGEKKAELAPNTGSTSLHNDSFTFPGVVAGMEELEVPVGEVHGTETSKWIVPMGRPMWLVQCGSSNVARPMWPVQCGSSNVARPMWPVQCGPSNVARPMWPVQCGSSNVARPMWLVQCGPSNVARPMWPVQCGSSNVARPMWLVQCGPSNVARPMWLVQCGSSNVARPMWLVQCGSITESSAESRPIIQMVSCYNIITRKIFVFVFHCNFTKVNDFRVPRMKW